MKKTLAVAALGLAVASVWLAAPANAGTVDKRTGYAAVSGRIDVINDKTSWDLLVWKLLGNQCVYAKVTLELSYPHRDYESDRICADGFQHHVVFKGTTTQSRTRGATVSLCQELPDRPDHCEAVWHEPARPPIWQ